MKPNRKKRSGMNETSVEETPFNDAVIMMIDDEPLVMEVLETSLREYGYQFFEKIEDSRIALDAIGKHRPDLVLLDLNMPHVDGFEILRALRANPDTRFLSVIVLTSSNESTTKLKALELGATDFLAKPIDRSELVLRLKNTLTVKAYQDQLAYYDTLTQLPNRKLFLDRLDWSLKSAARGNEQVAVMNVAIDRFQQVNEMLGTQAGDSLLVKIAQRLVKTLRESDAIGRGGHEAQWRNIARLSGDEFSVLLTEFKNTSKVINVAERIRQAMREPFTILDRDIFITTSIGIASFPMDGQDTDTLMKHAGAATKHAKENGRDRYQFFLSEINEAAQKRMKLEHSLRRVTKRNELQLYYQPKVSARTEAIVGIEALLRWRHPEQGFIPPSEFIPIAEEAGMIVEIGEWVLHQACTQAAAWNRAGQPDLKISVNVSAQQFRDNQFPHILQRILTETGLNPENLVLEITEGVLIGDKSRIADLLFKIKTTGAMISIDDFGIGYSSLSYLKVFPIDELKIDRSFIIDVPHDEDASSIVKAIVAMALSLNLKVVAEGVETADQLTYLKALGCDLIQGFYFAKPMPAKNIERLYFAPTN